MSHSVPFDSNSIEISNLDEFENQCIGLGPGDWLGLFSMIEIHGAGFEAGLDAELKIYRNYTRNAAS